MPLANLPLLPPEGALAMTALSLKERMAILKKIRSAELERFGSNKYIAVRISDQRILDADDDKGDLECRVAAEHPIDSFFTAPAPRGKAETLTR
jgi:hypothetical protein